MTKLDVIMMFLFAQALPLAMMVKGAGSVEQPLPVDVLACLLTFFLVLELMAIVGWLIFMYMIAPLIRLIVTGIMK